MRKVVSQLHLSKYTLLSLDGPIPAKEHRKYRIDGIEYNIVPVYDMPNSIAIATEGHFVGKTVEFI